MTTAASPDVSGVTTRLPGANVVWITQAKGFAQRPRPKVLLPIVPMVVALPAIYEPPEFLAEPTELYAPAVEIPAPVNATTGWCERISSASLTGP